MGDTTEMIDDLLLNDPEMVEGFVTEAKEHLETIEDDFLILEREKENPEQTLLDKVFRSIHSVKGAAGFLGLSTMTDLTHVMETLLTRMRSREIRPESQYIDVLLAGVDLLTAMLKDIEQSNEVDIAEVLGRLNNLLDQDTVEVRPAQQPSPQSQRVKEKTAPVVHKSTFDFGSTVRIHTDLLDKLMALAGELVLVRNQHLQTVDESNAVSRSNAHRLDLITSELQAAIISTRMQPVGKVIDKFPRIVRDLGKSLGKQIRITITGSEAELDKTMLESLTDPLIHIMRNSCGHGIESPEDRVKAGKPKTGQITLSAYHEAGRVNIKITDDGRGVDVDRIHRKILERGLKTEAELDQMSHQEVLNLVFLPGFSTMDKADDVSGRGVGMDVVKTSIEKLGGSFDFESVMGQGTTIILRLPLTLAIIPSLIITSREQVYAIPQVSLVELVTLYDEDIVTRIERAGDQEVFRLRDRLLPIVRLSEVLAAPQLFIGEIRAEITERYYEEQKKAWQEYGAAKARGDDVESNALHFVVLKVGNNHYGLVFDRIIGTEEIVVKPMHSAVKSLGIYSGATIMGNGKTALILDVGGIARHAGITLADKIMEEREKAFRSEELQAVLVFKSGPKEQFALPLPLIRRIEPISMQDIELIGDREYITVDGTSTLIVRLDHVLDVSPITDQEKMHLILPRHLKRSLGILMSGFVDVIETAVDLDFESYQADGVIGTSVLKESMTLFLDIYGLVEIIEPEYGAKKRQSLPGADSPKAGAGQRILLLEDVAFFRNLIKGYLEAEGYLVVAVKNGQLGLEQMEENEFDVIISDLEMPVMDGWDFMKNVRQGEQKGIPAVALTSLDTEKDRQKAKECGFNHYEVKLDRDHFLATVIQALSG